MTSDWISFWDKPQCIYVSARHKDVHYKLIAQELAQQIAALGASRPAHVLDYGCGEALHADVVAAECGALLLCEGAPTVRAGLARRFSAFAKIRVLAPEEIERLPDHGLDLVVLHSVAQYLKPDQMQALLAAFHRLLQPDGAVLVSDVIPPQLASATDAAALLRFAASNGFLLAALAGISRTLFSDYWRLRTQIGLAHYSETAMIGRLAEAGFTAHRMERNFGHNQARMAFIARPR